MCIYIYYKGCAAALARVRYLFDVDEFFVVGLAFSDESLLENFHENDLFMLCMEHPEKVLFFNFLFVLL